MNDKIKKILNYHREHCPGVTIVKVTTTKYYEIPAGSSIPTSELLKEWFEDNPTSKRHAFRDSSLLIDHWNNDAKVLEEEI
jgi:hypothetical protein